MAKKIPPRIPPGVIERLSAYLECLMQVELDGVKTISSEKIGKYIGVNPAEVRRDFTFFGTFGKKGVGYNVKNLAKKLKHILGSDEPHKIALVGAGNLGTAIASYDGFKKHGFFIEQVFDSDPKKVGVKIGNVPVSDIGDLPRMLRDKNIKIGILAVPSEAAQATADLLVKSGAKVVINYTTAMVKVPKSVKIHNTEPVKELLHTLYYFSSQGETI